MSLLVNIVLLQTLYCLCTFKLVRSLSWSRRVVNRFSAVAQPYYTTNQILITWCGAAFSYSREPQNSNIKQYFTIQCCHSLWKGFKVSQIDNGKKMRRVKEAMQLIGIRFHMSKKFLQKISYKCFWLFGVFFVLWCVSCQVWRQHRP